jgi:hypothetical protein
MPPTFPRELDHGRLKIHPLPNRPTLTPLSSADGMSCAHPCRASGERYLRLVSRAGQLVAVERHHAYWIKPVNPRELEEMVLSLKQLWL